METGKATPIPVTFSEDRHVAVWGYERWLVSAHPSAPSVVASGPFAGRRLDELCRTFGADLVGTNACGRFPLLIKEIAAARNLSIQVHPNERTFRVTGGEPKSEMWRVLGSEPGGALFAGVRPGTSRAKLAKAIEDGAVEDIVLRHAAVEGENVFLPGGLVHSLGGGVRVLEVQQSSDTTFRLYDWNRLGADGKPRALHVREGLAAAELGLEPTVANGDFSCPFFRVHLISPQSEMEMPATPDTCHVLFAEEGGFTLESTAGKQTVPQSSVVLVPAVTSAVVIPLANDTRVVDVTVGRMRHPRIAHELRNTR